MLKFVGLLLRPDATLLTVYKDMLAIFSALDMPNLFLNMLLPSDFVSLAELLERRVPQKMYPLSSSAFSYAVLKDA